MVELIGYPDAVRIKSVVDGAKRSMVEADEFVKKLRDTGVSCLRLLNYSLMS